ncbi:unnamed protein product [Ascophyllum nodosum]
MDQRRFIRPQRSASIGMSEGGGDKRQPVVLSNTESPYATRLPLRPAPSSGLVHPVASATGTPGRGAAATGNSYYGTSAKEMSTPELIRPSPGNPSRQSEPPTAMFNLLATVVGGGILSVPYALSLTGVVTGIFLMAVAAVAGDFSLYILCSCARRTGKVSYTEVAQVALGPLGGHAVTALLAALTIFVIIAYMVLVRDLWSGVVEALIGRALDGRGRTQVLLVALGVVFPVCLVKDLHALRHFCYVGFASAIVLTAAITYRSIEANDNNPEARLGLKLTADSWGDVFEAFPILSLAYMCHFNILSVHSQFVKPTRERLKGIIHGTVGLSSILYITFGLGGYVYAYQDTQDDILLNFDPSDRVIVLGRLGMGLTMLVAISLMVLPCRDIMYTLLAVVGSGLQERFCRKEYLPVEDDGAPSNTGESSLGTFLKAVQHVVMTAGIFLFCLYFALGVPGVGAVWSICGSSVGFTVSYLLPAGFYLKIRSHKPFNVRKASAWIVVVVSLVAIVLCTTNAVQKAML